MTPSRNCACVFTSLIMPGPNVFYYVTLAFTDNLKIIFEYFTLIILRWS